MTHIMNHMHIISKHTWAEIAWVTVYSVSFWNWIHKVLHWTGVINVLDAGTYTFKQIDINSQKHAIKKIIKIFNIHILSTLSHVLEANGSFEVELLAFFGSNKARVSVSEILSASPSKRIAANTDSNFKHWLFCKK